jgi:N-acetylglucosamine-6-sulfatase
VVQGAAGNSKTIRVIVSSLLAVAVVSTIVIVRREPDNAPAGSSTPITSPTPTPATPTSSPASPLPNIVLILTDDQRWDSLWAMPKVRRLLAGPGVRFTNAFAVNPLCCPSRASILTGKYSHGTGVYTNFPPTGGFPAFDPSTTIATVLDERGYETALMGKYLNGYLGTDVPPGWDRWAAFNGPKGGVSFFDYTMSLDGVERSFGSAPSDYSTDVLARRAARFIRDAGGPFFLYFAPSAPHMPALAPPRDADALPSIAPSRPPSFNEPDFSDKPRWLRSTPRYDDGLVDREDEIRTKQLRSLPAVDDAVERIVDALRAAGELDRTMIVFASDNGFLHGEHRLGGKQAAYEESIRVPMILRYDALTAGRGPDPRIALNIDLAPTFAEAAGTHLDGADGRSLLDLLRHPSRTGRRWFLIEHVQDESRYLPRIPTYCGVRSARWKYVEYADGSRELYDLVADPYEQRNLVDDQSSAAAFQVASAQLRRLCDPPPPGFSGP